MEYAGINKASIETTGMEKYSQNLPNLPHSQCHSNVGFRSADNLLNNDGHKNSNYEEFGEGSESEMNNKTQRLQPSVSASYLVGSPVFVCTSNSPYTSTPSSEMNKSSVPEYCADQGSEQSFLGKSVELKNNSPLHKFPVPSENGDNNKASVCSNSTPSPSLISRSKLQHASGESSDEKVEKRDRSKASSSREGSFERSVSFQESHFLDPEKSSEYLRTSDSNRSLDLSRAVDTSTPQSHASSGKDKDRDRKESRESKPGDKDKKNKKAWYSVLNPTYKSRSEELKKLFKDLPSDERLIVDYSCALQKDILVHGRLYVTSNYFSFYSKIFGWETLLSIKCKDIIALTKEKTALVIPNALQINTDSDKHFFTSFAARDKTYLMLFRIWQNALMDQLPLPNLSRMRRMYTSPYALQMSAPELWQWVHSSYGEELGLTSDDDDYVAPSTEDDMKICSTVHPEVILEDGLAKLKRNSIDSVEEDVSQGESNLEEEKQGLVQSASHDYALLESSRKSPTKSPVKSPSLPTSITVSHFPVSCSGDKDIPEIPTDLSDTVDSDPDKEKSIGSIAETIMCPNIASHHIGREVASAVYALPIDTLFTLLFTSSKFMFDLHAERKTYDVVISPWQSNPETNQKIRQVTYTLTLPTNSFGPKVSHVTETQVISAFSKPSEIYTIDAEASNSGIPYADSFFVSNHWCLTRESASETRLTLWSQVKYKKNVWGFMKSVIDKNAFSGMESLVSDINASLLLEVDKTMLKRTKRRRRRAGSKGNEVGDPLHVPSPTASNIDIHKSTQIPSRKMILPSVTTDTISQAVGSSVKSATIFFLCALLVVNAFLYYRLYNLEERVVNNVPLKSIGFDSSAFKFGGQYSDDGLVEEWVQILRHQESLHAEELERWRKTVIEAADHLRKAEESLRHLHSSIPSKQASKMQSLLQRLQLLQQMHEPKKIPPKVPSTEESPVPLKEPPLEREEL